MTVLCPVTLTPLATKDFSNQLSVCSGNGRCMSLREVSLYQDYVVYSESAEYSGWDADMIHGCVCDPGWEGVSCGKRSCPRGDDPLTPATDDVQLVDCKCTTCQGGMYLTFQGQQTSFLPYNAPAALIQYRLQVSVIGRRTA